MFLARYRMLLVNYFMAALYIRIEAAGKRERETAGGDSPSSGKKLAERGGVRR
ncbi:MAG: hypothetical protein PHD91_04170 [bacterium]|nr:hypothetical protein [bacterium]